LKSAVLSNSAKRRASGEASKWNEASVWTFFEVTANNEC